MKKLLLLLPFVIILSACSAAKRDVNISSASGNSSSVPPAASQMNESEIWYSTATSGSVSDAKMENDIAEDTIARPQKIVRNADISLSVSNFDGSYSSIKKIADDLGGYVETSNSYVVNYSPEREFHSGTIVLRVPSNSFEQAISVISSFGDVTNESENAQNMTTQYYDAEARLVAREAEEARLLKMIDDASTISDLILLENRLSEVRWEIESYKTQMLSIDRLSSFSTITVALHEKDNTQITPISTKWGDRIHSAFIGSINAISIFFQGLVVFVAAAFLPLLLLSALALAIFLIFKKISKKRTDKHDQP